jgi:hypothetical protein
MWVVSFLSTSLLHMILKKSARAPHAAPPRRKRKMKKKRKANKPPAHVPHAMKHTKGLDFRSAGEAKTAQKKVGGEK